MNIPKDPYILVSFINMKLRDRCFESLTDLCDSLDISEDDIKTKLEDAGFQYDKESKQFR